MIKLIFKIIGWIIAIACVLLTLYFLFSAGGSGITTLKDLFENGFWDGIKTFFTEIWNGFKTVVGLN